MVTGGCCRSGHVVSLLGWDPYFLTGFICYWVTVRATRTPLQLLKLGTATGPWLYFIYDLMFDIKKGKRTLFCVAFILGCKVSIIYLHCHCTVGYDYLEVNTVTGNCIDFMDTEVKAHLRVVDVWILTRSPELRIPHSSMGLGLTTWHFVSLRSSSNSILQPPSTYRWK